MGDFLPWLVIEKKILIGALLIAKKKLPEAKNLGKLHRDLFDYSAVIFPM